MDYPDNRFTMLFDDLYKEIEIELLKTYKTQDALYNIFNVGVLTDTALTDITANPPTVEYENKLRQEIEKLEGRIQNLYKLIANNQQITHTDYIQYKRCICELLKQFTDLMDRKYVHRFIFELFVDTRLKLLVLNEILIIMNQEFTGHHIISDNSEFGEVACEHTPLPNPQKEIHKLRYLVSRSLIDIKNANKPVHAEQPNPPDDYPSSYAKYLKYKTKYLILKNNQ
jgi:hypothetical protein